MLDKSDSASIPPAIRDVAKQFQRTGWISFWLQLGLGVVSTIVLIVANFSRGAGDNAATSRVGTGFGVFFAVCGLATLVVSTFWAFRYTRVARQLQDTNTSLRPSRADTLKLLQIGVAVNLIGMLLTIVGAQAIVGGLIARSIAQPQAYPLYGTNAIPIIRPLDFFVVQANTNTIAAHFVGIVASLWLFNRANR